MRIDQDMKLEETKSARSVGVEKKEKSEGKLDFASNLGSNQQVWKL